MSASKRHLSQALSSTVNLYCNGCHSQIGIFDNDWIRLTTSYARAQSKGTHFGTEIGRKIQIVPNGVAQSAAAGCEMAEVFCKSCSSMVGQYCKGSRDVEKRYLIDEYFYKLTRTYLKDARTFLQTEHIFGMSDNTARHGSHAPSTAIRAGSRVPQPQGARRMESVPRQTHNKQFGHLNTDRRRSSLSYVSRYPQDDSLMDSDPAQEANEEADEVTEILQRQEEQLIAQEKLLEKQSAILSKHSVQLTDLKKTIGSTAMQSQEQATTSSAVLAQLQILQQTVEKLQMSIDELKSESGARQASITDPYDEAGDCFEFHAMKTQHQAPASEIEGSQVMEEPAETGARRGFVYEEDPPLNNTPPTATPVLGKRKRLDIVSEVMRMGREREERFAKWEREQAERQAQMEREREELQASSLKNGEPQLPTPQSMAPLNISRQGSPQIETSFDEARDDDVRRDLDEPMIADDDQMIGAPSAAGAGSDDHNAKDNPESEQLDNNTAQNRLQIAKDKIVGDTVGVLPGSEQTGIADDQAVQNVEVSIKDQELSVQDEQLSIQQSDTRSPKAPENTRQPQVTPQLHQPEQAATTGDTRQSLDQTLNADALAINPDLCEVSFDVPAGPEIEFQDGFKTQDDNIDPRLRSSVGNNTHINPVVNDINGSQESQGSTASSTREQSMLSDMDDSSMMSSQPPSTRGNNRRETSGFDQGVRSMAPEPVPRRRTMHDGVKMIDLDDARHFTPASVARKIQRKGLPPEKTRRIQTSERALNKELTKLGLTEWIGKDKNNREYRKAVAAGRARAREQAKQEVLMKLNPPNVVEPTSSEVVSDVKPTEAVQPPPPPAPTSLPPPFAPVASTLMYPSGVPLCSPMSYQPFGPSPSRFSTRAIVFNPFANESDESGKDENQKPAPISPSEQKRQRLAKIRERDRLVKELMEKDD